MGRKEKNQDRHGGQRKKEFQGGGDGQHHAVKRECGFPNKEMVGKLWESSRSSEVEHK